MPRKIFISVLGTNLYAKCKYASGNFTSSETCFIQHATLEYINAKNWTQSDTALFLLTEKAKKENWNKDITSRKDFKGVECAYKGLAKVLEDMRLPCEMRNISIPDGKDEKEIWEIFNLMYWQIKEGDEIYLDITHGFRLLPMLIMVFCDYIKFLKNAAVKYISYGNYEARDITSNTAPLIDLMPFISLQNWTVAAASFFKNGDIRQLNELTKTETLDMAKDRTHEKSQFAIALKEYVCNLERIVLDMQMCRGNSIYNGSEIKKLKERKDLEEIVIAPLKPIIEKANQSLKDFSETPNIKNGYFAAKWCAEHNLYQQAVTIIEENMISDLCLEMSYNYNDKESRKFVSKSLSFGAKTICDNEAEQSELKKIQKLDKYNKLKTIFNNIRSFRNDYNHAGISDNPSGASALRKNICKNIDDALKIIGD
ncbi:MAG: TIGR02221 family CRISPR-associated protein [Endomicrobia bacterium]|nr:TIGR02221 family CRISPR-associated protein [Endomicrobiia bacterium]MCL2506285.1 TIGR02221 family CRISPR-associated protein [Endomicrobiia bacterium]